MHRLPISYLDFGEFQAMAGPFLPQGVCFTVLFILLRSGVDKPTSPRQRLRLRAQHTLSLFYCECINAQPRGHALYEYLQKP